MANKINAADIPQVYTAATFAETKKKLIDFLSNQDEFKDYSFEGARINVLLDLLAYNTMYVQQFSNTALYESFHRTAKLRSSVVQHAQDQGYMPNAYTAATNTVRMTAYHTPLETSPISVTIPYGTKFTASIEQVDFYDYVTWDDVEVIKGINNRYITDLKLVQGRIVRQEMTFSKGSRIYIFDPFIDRKYVRVFVDGAQWTDWTLKPMVQGGSTSTIFYQRETIDGYTEIYFGEGEQTTTAAGQLQASYVGGLKPAVGAKLVIEYVTTDGKGANGCRHFEYIDTIPSLVVESVVENPFDDMDYIGATGGGDPEDIERIREMGAVMRETQRRAVTAPDYDAFVSYAFGNIVQAVKSYTDSEKPGYVFIPIKPKDGLTLTTVQKEDIQNFLKDFNVSTITPVVHSPNYLYVKKHVKVTYSLNDLNATEEWLMGQVLNAIDRYYVEEVELFGRGFYTSKMNSRVDAADVSILGTTTTIDLVREVENFFTSPMAGISFLNTIGEGTVSSSEIIFQGKAESPYYVHFVGTKKNGVVLPGSGDTSDISSGLLLMGPFAAGDITATAYTGTDFDKQVIDGRSLYYPVGYVKYGDDAVTFDLGILNADSSKFTAAYIELQAKPAEQNIFVQDGSMIVFENRLRPQYTTIQMEAIAS